MDIQPVGRLNYSLYCLGWHSGLHHHLPLPQHWFLSIFFYYRRGFKESSKWKQNVDFQQSFERNSERESFTD